MLVATTIALVAGAAPARSQTESVTLTASRAVVTYGASTALSGAISPPAAGETVAVVDVASTEVLATAVTDKDGAYRLSFPPERNVEVRAEWGGATSEPVAIRVRPVLTASIRNVLLFGRATVAGRLRPPHEGTRVSITLVRGGSVVATREARLDGEGRYSARLRIARPGRYRARVRFEDEDHLPAAAGTSRRMTPLPSLGPGSRSIHVRLLERRLDELDYRILGINRAYDFRTGDAVLAFHKVQGMPRVKSVGPATWRKLARPFRPTPRARKPRFHIEIDQTRQVLYVVREGRIDEIVHTSTGRNNWTRDGVWRVHRKIAGYSPNRLWYPSYFDGLRAVHGWPEVPAYPASHGCARVPYWTAIWLHGLMDYGTVVRVYH